ncbi:MAG TPA: GNAT family N-acetyltransferase [Microthrixaceae bacterium]|nr:GNAT family N-acetyltransferase [Microthrixaceae bacterium]
MGRHRFAVVLLAPPNDAAMIDALRRSVGVDEPFHVAPHVTIVPPTNVADTDVDDVLRTLRRVAASNQPVEMEIGPAESFRPETPTLHLAVGGSDIDVLRSMRGDLRTGPLDRPEAWPFQPHATIAEAADDDMIDAGLTILRGFRQRWNVSALHLLEQRRGDPAHGEHGRAPWVPIREEPLGGPVISGRGGVEISLRVVSMVEPPAAELLGIEATVPPVASGPTPIVLVAEAPAVPGPVLAVVSGHLPAGSTVAVLERIAVDPDHRGQGIGGRVLARWCRHVAQQGAVQVTATLTDDESEGRLGELLGGEGFEQLTWRWTREL